MKTRKTKKKRKKGQAKHIRSNALSHIEFNRQMMHVLVGLGFVAVLLFFGLKTFQNFLLGLLLVGIVLSVLVQQKKVNALKELLAFVERPKEGVPGQAVFVFVVGIAITSFVFSELVPVLVGIVCLTFQDAFSSLFGMRFGKTKIFRNKTVEGSVGGFLACFIALLTFLPVFHALVISLAATLVEILPVDDAFSIPLVSAFLVRFWL